MDSGWPYFARPSCHLSLSTKEACIVLPAVKNWTHLRLRAASASCGRGTAGNFRSGAGPSAASHCEHQPTADQTQGPGTHAWDRHSCKRVLSFSCLGARVPKLVWPAPPTGTKSRQKILH
eukprot:3197499-Rhodomonas_salina.1